MGHVSRPRGFDSDLSDSEDLVDPEYTDEEQSGNNGMDDPDPIHRTFSPPAGSNGDMDVDEASIGPSQARPSHGQPSWLYSPVQ